METMLNTIMLTIFWMLQVVALVFLKHGAMGTRRAFLICFILANVLCVFSLWPLMLVYKSWPANVVLALQVGVGFVIGQVVLALVYPSGLTLVQVGGMVAITVGIAMVSLGALR